MLLQLHHEHPAGGRDFIAQTEVPEDSTNVEFSKFLAEWKADVETRHPLPPGCRWFVCNDQAKEFMLANPEGSD